MNLEAHHLQVNGISMALHRVQIGIDKALHGAQSKLINSKKAVITKIN